MSYKGLIKTFTPDEIRQMSVNPSLAFWAAGNGTNLSKTLAVGKTGKTILLLSATISIDDTSGGTTLGLDTGGGSGQGFWVSAMHIPAEGGFVEKSWRLPVLDNTNVIKEAGGMRITSDNSATISYQIHAVYLPMFTTVNRTDSEFIVVGDNRNQQTFPKA